MIDIKHACSFFQAPAPCIINETQQNLA